MDERIVTWKKWIITSWIVEWNMQMKSNNLIFSGNIIRDDCFFPSFSFNTRRGQKLGKLPGSFSVSLHWSGKKFPTTVCTFIGINNYRLSIWLLFFHKKRKKYRRIVKQSTILNWINRNIETWRMLKSMIIFTRNPIKRFLFLFILYPQRGKQNWQLVLIEPTLTPDGSLINGKTSLNKLLRNQNAVY